MFRLGHLLQDVRYSLRSLRKSPLFAVSAIATLALGIGANTAIFSVVEAVVLAPLPFFEPQRLTAVQEISLTLKRDMSVSYPDFWDWQRNARSFDRMAAIRFEPFDLTSPGPAEHLDGRLVSAGFFRTLGVKLNLGREFSPQEDRYRGAPVAIISDRLWKNRFAGSATALGRSMTLNGAGYTIVGVLSPEFRFWTYAADADVYTPLGQGDPIFVTDRTIHPGILCIARLKPGVTMAAARAEMAVIQDRLDELHPAEDRGLGTNVVPLKQQVVGDSTSTLLMLLGAVGLVLLIACANVANLLLARSVARAREFAIRSALGASRARIAAQLAAEGTVLSLAGGALGLAAAKFGLGPALTVFSGSLPRGENIGVDMPVLLFTMAISIAAGMLFSVAPVLRISQGRIGSVRVQHRTQNVLVVVQMALTLVLLLGASLLFRTLQNLWKVNPGFNTQQIVTFRVGLSPSLAKTAAATRISYRQLIDRIREIPGVAAADLTALVPLSPHGNAGPFWVGNHEPASSAQAPRATYYWVGPDYARTMQIPIVRGRFLTAQDTMDSAPVAVIDAALAHSYFPDSDPVGQIIHIPHWGDATIVGLVGHVRHWGMDDPDRYTQNEIYASFYQLADAFVPVFRGDLSIAVRSPLDVANILPAVKAAAHDDPVYDVESMRRIVSESMAPRRFPMLLLGAFALLALLLASVGIYGVLSYLMAGRVREIGIRMALGAESGDVSRMVLGQGLRLVVCGIAIGTVSALALSRVLSSFSQMLYGVDAGDPLTSLIVSLVMLGAALLACYIPARRTARLDPMIALRHD